MLDKKRSYHLRLGSSAANALLEVAAYAGDILDAIDRPYLAARMGIGAAKELRLERLYQTRRRAMFRLKERGLIAQAKIADGLAYALTERGVVEILRQKVLSAEMMTGDVVCMVMFDIPEVHRELRIELTRFLEAAGFIRFQKSVFISPFDAFVPLAMLFRLKKADAWVTVYRAERVTHEVRSAQKRHRSK